MEASRKKYPFRRKEGPSFRVFSGYNQRFFTEVNENLDKFFSEKDREYYLNRYGRINQDFDYLSPVYFAAAIAFLNNHKEGPTPSNFNDKAVDKYVKPLILLTPPNIPASTLNLRRKIELLRYIRLVLKIDSMYYPTGRESITYEPNMNSPLESPSRSPSRSPSPKKSTKKKKAKDTEAEEPILDISPPETKKKKKTKSMFFDEE